MSEFEPGTGTATFIDSLGGHDGHGSPDLAHHFEDLPQQHGANVFGMWVFLASEVLFFGGILSAFSVYRHQMHDGFRAAAAQLSPITGVINTAVLLCSSLTMALAVQASTTTNRKAQVGWLVATLALGTAFVGIKMGEWYVDYKEGFVPGSGTVRYSPIDAMNTRIASDEQNSPRHGFHDAHFTEMKPPVNPRQAEMFFVFYFCMTGLHALHMLVGFGLLLALVYMAYVGKFGPGYNSPVEMIGLYWHFVDIVWIFLFPILYLLRD